MMVQVVEMVYRVLLVSRDLMELKVGVDLLVWVYRDLLAHRVNKV